MVSYLLDTQRIWLMKLTLAHWFYANKTTLSKFASITCCAAEALFWCAENFKNNWKWWPRNNFFQNKKLLFNDTVQNIEKNQILRQCLCTNELEILWFNFPFPEFFLNRIKINRYFRSVCKTIYQFWVYLIWSTRLDRPSEKNLWG